MNKSMKIGTIGFDVCKLTGFQADPQSQAELWRRANNGECFGDIEVKPIKRGGLTVTGHGFQICIARSNLTGPYMWVEIHAADWDGCNLENLNAEGVFAKLAEMLAYVQSVCRLRVSYRVEDLRITKCEINNTFAVKNVYANYQRVTQFLSAFSSGKNGVVLSASVSELKGTLQTTSLLARRGSSSGFRVYDKSRDMFDKLGGVRTQATSLMRMEFVINKGQRVKSVLGTDRLLDVTDQTIEKAYRKMLDKLMDKAEKYLQEKLTYRNGQTGHNDTAANMFYRYCFLRKDFAAFLAEVTAYEAIYHVPCLLDLTDVHKILSDYVGSGMLSSDEALWMESELTRVCSSTSQADVLMGQRQLLDEIYTAASANCPQEITVYR